MLRDFDIFNRRLQSRLVVLAILVSTTISASSCQQQDEKANVGDNQCGSLRSYRIEKSGSLKEEELADVQWCKTSEEVFWGQSPLCMVSPNDQLYIVIKPHGTKIVGAEEWKSGSSLSDSEFDLCQNGIENFSGSLEQDAAEQKD